MRERIAADSAYRQLTPAERTLVKQNTPKGKRPTWWSDCGLLYAVIRSPIDPTAEQTIFQKGQFQGID